MRIHLCQTYICNLPFSTPHHDNNSERTNKRRKFIQKLNRSSHAELAHQKLCGPGDTPGGTPFHFYFMKENSSRFSSSPRRLLVWMIVVVFLCLFGSLLYTISESSSLPEAVEGEIDERLCRAAEFDPFSDVIQLTEDNFEQLVLADQESVWLVEL